MVVLACPHLSARSEMYRPPPNASTAIMKTVRNWKISRYIIRSRTSMYVPMNLWGQDRNKIIITLNANDS